jgi:hypothetical protein
MYETTMTTNKTNISLNREDISRFVIHLTRDDRQDFKGGGGATAIENLNRIVRERQIMALRPHCLHKKQLKDAGMPKAVLEAFDVACFTEVPLSQIHLLTQPIEGVAYQREPYGVVFNRKLLIDSGAQPAIYVNSYGGNIEVRTAFDQLFENCRATKWKDDSWKLLPFVNAMHERYDFTWEREWRTNKAFKFKLSDIVALILPAEGEDEFRSAAIERGIPCISPGWTYEMIVAELSAQQKSTRRVFKAAAASEKKSSD